MNLNKMAYSKEIPLKLLFKRSVFSDEHQSMILSYIPEEQTAFDFLFGSMTEAEVETMMEHYRPNDCAGRDSNQNRWFRQICVVGMNRATYPAIQRMVIAAPYARVNQLDYLLKLTVRLTWMRCKLLGLSRDTGVSASNDVIWINERAFAGILPSIYNPHGHDPGECNWVDVISFWDSEYHKPSERWHEHVTPRD